MMKKATIRYFGFFLLLGCLISACQKTFDKEEPTALFDTTAVEFVLFIGDSLDLPIYLKDSNGLAQYKLSVKLSPHSELIDSTRADEPFDVWSFLAIGDLGGKVQSFPVTITSIEENPLPGLYYLILNATDDAYNIASDTVVIKLKYAEDTIAPQLSMINPLPGDDFTNGDTMFIAANVPDLNSAMGASGTWQVIIRLVPDFSGEEIHTIKEISDMELDFVSHTMIWDTSYDAGNYFLRFIMRDQYNNVDSAQISLVKF